MIGGEDVSVRTDDHTRAEALQCLFALSLRSAPTEKLTQRIIGKRKPRLRARHRLCGKYRHDTRRDLLHNRPEGRYNSLARLLRQARDQTSVTAQHHECEQRTRSQNPPVHDGFACKKESDAQAISALFLICCAKETPTLDLSHRSRAGASNRTAL